MYIIAAAFFHAFILIYDFFLLFLTSATVAAAAAAAIPFITQYHGSMNGKRKKKSSFSCYTLVPYKTAAAASNNKGSYTPKVINLLSTFQSFKKFYNHRYKKFND
jgi:hypothetical protein